jgi:hypothetical protein
MKNIRLSAASSHSSVALGKLISLHLFLDIRFNVLLILNRYQIVVLSKASLFEILHFVQNRAMRARRRQ